MNNAAGERGFNIKRESFIVFQVGREGRCHAGVHENFVVYPKAWRPIVGPDPSPKVAVPPQSLIGADLFTLEARLVGFKTIQSGASRG